jgi:hypothetical protein
MSEFYEKQQWDEIIEQVHKGKHFFKHFIFSDTFTGHDVVTDRNFIYYCQCTFYNMVKCSREMLWKSAEFCTG